MTASLPAGLVAGQPETVVAELRNTTNCTLDTAAIIVPLLGPLDPSEVAVWRGFCADPVDYCLANPDASACLQLFELCDILPGLGLCQAFCEKVSDGTAPWCENGLLSAAATPTSAAEILALLPAHVRDRIDAGALQAFLDRFADTSGSTSAPELLGPASAIPLSCALGTGEFGGLGAFCGEGAPVMLPPSDTLRITATGTVPADLPGGYWLGWWRGRGDHFGWNLGVNHLCQWTNCFSFGFAGFFFESSSHIDARYYQRDRYYNVQDFHRTGR